MADRRDLELARALGVSSDLRRSQLLAAVRDLVAFRMRASPAVVEAAEIARGRIYDQWRASDDLSTAAVRQLIRDAFEAGERHREAWAALRTVERTWIAPDEVPVDQR
jgi:hypothetical protein